MKVFYALVFPKFCQYWIAEVVVIAVVVVIVVVVVVKSWLGLVNTNWETVGARVGKYNLGTSADKCKVLARVGKQKLGVRTGKYKSGASAGIYKLGVRAGAKQKAGVREIQRPNFINPLVPGVHWLNKSYFIVLFIVTRKFGRTKKHSIFYDSNCCMRYLKKEI